MPHVPDDEAINAPLVGLDDVVRDARPGALRMALVGSEAVRIVLLRLAPGHEPHPPHRHPGADEVMLVQQGHGRFTVGDEPAFLAGPNSLVYVPRNVVHRIEIPGPESLVCLSIVTPNLDAPDEAVEA